MKSVFITGAGSGIGYATAHYLADRDFIVYASMRNPEDFKKFNHKNIIPVVLDVTKTDDVANISKVISSDHQLIGIINNAGIGPIGFLHTFSEDEMIHLFDVNVFGPWRVTNAFLPLLLETTGKVINVSSQGGITNKPFFGPYSMTKYAIEAYTDVLREELAPYGIFVSVIQPGGVVTSIGDKSVSSNIKRLKQAKSPFDEVSQTILETMTEDSQIEYDPSQPESEINRNPANPEKISQIIYNVLTDPFPKHRYLHGTRWEGNRVIDHLLQKLVDENNSPNMHYTTEELVSLLREKMNDN